MDTGWKAILWSQFGAAIDMLERAIVACPERVWSDRTRRHQFWYVAFHTAFWLDCYLAESEEAYRPPAPFDRGELEADWRPERVYTKAEVLELLRHGRENCRARIDGLSEGCASERSGFDYRDMTVAELIVYNLRHVQHHAAQLNLILRETVDSVPQWVSKVGRGAPGPVG